MHNKYMKSFVASAAITACTIVKSDGAGGVIAATGPTDALLGPTDNLDIAIGQTTDVAMMGEAFVKLGGTVVLMDPLTSDANGKAVKAVPAAGVNNRIIGYATQAGVTGDIITYLGQAATIQG